MCYSCPFVFVFITGVLFRLVQMSFIYCIVSMSAVVRAINVAIYSCVAHQVTHSSNTQTNFILRNWRIRIPFIRNMSQYPLIKWSILTVISQCLAYDYHNKSRFYPDPFRAPGVFWSPELLAHRVLYKHDQWPWFDLCPWHDRIASLINYVLFNSTKHITPHESRDL